MCLVSTIALGAAGLVGGAALAGSMKPDTPDYPDPLSPGDEARSWLEAMSDPSVMDPYIASLEKYNPRMAQLQLGIQKDIMQQEGGLFDLLSDASQRSFELQQGQLEQQRGADVEALLKYAPQIVEGYREADPYSAGTADLQREMAQDLYAKSKGLTGQEERMAQQQARAASASRGLQFGQGSLAAELLGREDVLASKRAEAQRAGQVAFGMDRTIAGDLGSVILGRPSSAIGMGQQMMNQATNIGQRSSVEGLMDPMQGVNLAAMERANLANYNANIYGAKSGMYGSIIGGGLGMLGGILG